MGRVIFFDSTKDLTYWTGLLSLDEVHDNKNTIVDIVKKIFRILDFI